MSEVKLRKIAFTLTDVLNSTNFRVFITRVIRYAKATAVPESRLIITVSNHINPVLTAGLAFLIKGISLTD